MGTSFQSWPEPLVWVQHLSESGIQKIPENYIKPPSDRPNIDANNNVEIPVIDMSGLYSNDVAIRESTAAMIDRACKEWGFFQLVNHGVSPELMDRVKEAWLEFFYLPLEEKQKYANDPKTYQGYGCRTGLEKGASLDWGDYFFLYCLPTRNRDENKWPALPISLREVIDEYGKQTAELCERILGIFSSNLGLEESYLQNALGGNDAEANMRANYYPKCPEPDLTFGLSPHSDPGGITLLLPDYDVFGLQLRHGDEWITVKPIPGSFIVNVADQIQILTNGIYKSVEHRVIVNSNKERFSLALFYNPKGEEVIKPAEKLVTTDHPAMYPAQTYNDYRKYIRMKGPRGKEQIQSMVRKR